MNQIKYIVRILLPLISQPEQTWQFLAKSRGDETRPDAMQKNFFLPLLGYMSLVVFLCAAFRSPENGVMFDYQYGMKQLVPVLIAYFLGPILAVMLLTICLRHVFHMPNPDKNRVQLFVYYSTSFLIALEMLESIIPSIRLLSLIFVYLLYITFCGSVVYIRVAPNRRWMAGLISFAIISVCPSLIINIMTKMQG